MSKPEPLKGKKWCNYIGKEPLNKSLFHENDIRNAVEWLQKEVDELFKLGFLPIEGLGMLSTTIKEAFEDVIDDD